MPDFGIFRGFNEKLFGDKLYAGQLPTQLGLIGSEYFGYLYLLDDYPAAAVAYSLRKLRSAYTGSAIRVRRADNNAEQDIGFVNNELDTSTLTSFCSGTDGFVKTWYDQSGNGNDASQTTASRQPQIVSSGSVIARNGKPYIEATSSRYFTFTELNAAINTNYSLWMTYEKDTTGNQAVLLKNGTNFLWLDYGTSQAVTNLDIITISTIHSINTLHLINNITNYSVGATQYRNGNVVGTRGALTAAAIADSLPSRAFRTAKITFSEFVYYPSDQSSNRTGIETNINTYYSIY